MRKIGLVFLPLFRKVVFLSMNKKYHLLFALVLIFPLLVSTAPVQADVAPPHAAAVGGLQSPDAQPTNVQMTFERVELEILEMPPEPDATKRYSNRQVEVNAWFILHNTGNMEEKMQVVFPLSDFNDFRSNVPYIPRGYMTLNIDRESFRALAMAGILIRRSIPTSAHCNSTLTARNRMLPMPNFAWDVTPL
jgi:hypothetical protein